MFLGRIWNHDLRNVSSNHSTQTEKLKSYKISTVSQIKKLHFRLHVELRNFSVRSQKRNFTEKIFTAVIIKNVVFLADTV
jgi:hypothetical protein